MAGVGFQGSRNAAFQTNRRHSMPNIEIDYRKKNLHTQKPRWKFKINAHTEQRKHWEKQTQTPTILICDRNEEANVGTIYEKCFFLLLFAFWK